MQETLEEVQQEAYGRGQQMQHWHQQPQRVVTDEALTVLVADFAQNLPISSQPTGECNFGSRTCGRLRESIYRRLPL